MRRRSSERLPGALGKSRSDFAGLIGALTNLRARLSAIQAFQAVGFQSLSDLVISLDLTGIIAFDVVREWEAARRLRCAIPVMGRDYIAAFTREKVRFAWKKQKRVCGS
ncbi:hypothetical protein [Mesorhizobium sp. M1027]|uniref:hypothetical protein n=1 Tax=Mesorhizobium sp. M1027 TaxID=2957050 RepID=UPI00333A4AD0